MAFGESSEECQDRGMIVTVVGSINMDLVSQVARFPMPGETILGGDLETIPGGKGANQAVAAARLGAKVTLVGRVGADIFGSKLRSNLAAEGIDISHVLQSQDMTTGVALILVNEDGQNTIVVSPGANGQLTPAFIDRAGIVIASADVLLLQLEIPLESVRRAAQIARENRVQVILNPAPARELPASLLDMVDILIPNESEAQRLLGETQNRMDHLQLAAAAERLFSLGIGAVIVTAGDRGALLVNSAGQRMFPAFPAERIVDTTAAGDAFVGGLAAATAAGKVLPEAILWGNAAGMLAVTRAGAQPSLPTWAEVERLVSQATPEQRYGILLRGE